VERLARALEAHDGYWSVDHTDPDAVAAAILAALDAEP
jgi:hypothetical protein